MLEEKGLFVGDLGEQRRHMQDVVGRINSDMRLLEEKGHNMVSRLSDMRGQISSSEHQRRRVVEELEDARAQLEEVTGAHMLARRTLTPLVLPPLSSTSGAWRSTIRFRSLRVSNAMCNAWPITPRSSSPR